MTSQKPRRVRRNSGEKIKIIFDRGVYVDKNTSQAVSVEFARCVWANYARSRLEKLGGKARRVFSTV